METPVNASAAQVEFKEDFSGLIPIKIVVTKEEWERFTKQLYGAPGL